MLTFYHEFFGPEEFIEHSPSPMAAALFIGFYGLVGLPVWWIYRLLNGKSDAPSRDNFLLGWCFFFVSVHVIVVELIK